MQTFLNQVAQRLLNDHPDDLGRCVVVFNNRRPSLFLRRELAKEAHGRALFLPTIMGMDDMIMQLGGLQIINHEFLLFELYDVHRTIATPHGEPQSFESFMPLADMLLADFSEIDLYDVDAKQLFHSLHELKSVMEWDPEAPDLSAFQRNYLDFYRSLYVHYCLLRERLERQGKAYGGMAYRKVAESIDTLLPAWEDKEVYFAGFNAFSQTEQTIVDAFLKRGRAHLLVDGDPYYTDDEQQEAGHFLRQLRQRYPDHVSIQPHFGSHEQSFTLVHCPENAVQAKAAAEQLQTLCLDSNQTAERTALVLADEKLLLPVLNALPEAVHKANITMGFPFVYSALHAMTLNLITLLRQRRGTKYYGPDVLTFLTSVPVCQLLGDRTPVAKLRGHFASQRLVRPGAEQIFEALHAVGANSDAISFIFSDENSDNTSEADRCLRKVRRLLNVIKDQEHVAHNPKEREAAISLGQILDHLEEIQQQYHFIQNLPTLERIYSRVAQRHAIPFYGEPLEGLQILGVLETRNLDFENVILLSVNEGTLPTGRTAATLIPFSVKRHFNMPTYAEKDAVYAYNFYRLLQRASHVDLFYHTDFSGGNKGEPSRYITQIETELAPRFPSIHLEHRTLTIPNTSIDETEEMEIAKTPQIMERLQWRSQAGFSPSALNVYRSCPVQFYYKNLLGLAEEDEVSEDMGDNEFGNVVHAALQQLLQQAENKRHELQADLLEQQLPNVEPLLTTQIREQVLQGSDIEGRNQYLLSMAISQVRHFLQKEIAFLKKGGTIQMLSVEEESQIPLRLNLDGHPTAYIKGRPDRIDRCNGILRVIDYKTGKVSEVDLRYKDGDTQTAPPPDKWFQVMCYAWLYSQQNNSALAYSSDDGRQEEEFVAGIVPLGHTDSEFQRISWNGLTTFSSEQLLRFQSMMQAVVEEIMNPNQPFSTKNVHKKEACKYCPCRQFCTSAVQ